MKTALDKTYKIDYNEYIRNKESVLIVGEENSSAIGILLKKVDLARIVRENPLQTISKKKIKNY